MEHSPEIGDQDPRFLLRYGIGANTGCGKITLIAKFLAQGKGRLPRASEDRRSRSASPWQIAHAQFQAARANCRCGHELQPANNTAPARAPAAW